MLHPNSAWFIFMVLWKKPKKKITSVVFKIIFLPDTQTAFCQQNKCPVTEHRDSKLKIPLDSQCFFLGNKDTPPLSPFALNILLFLPSMVHLWLNSSLKNNNLTDNNQAEYSYLCCFCISVFICIINILRPKSLWLSAQILSVLFILKCPLKICQYHLNLIGESQEKKTLIHKSMFVYQCLCLCTNVFAPPLASFSLETTW